LFHAAPHAFLAQSPDRIVGEDKCLEWLDKKVEPEIQETSGELSRLFFRGSGYKALVAVRWPMAP
jgi:hypothetical protein